jgi:predicted nucleic acid-binding protein
VFVLDASTTLAWVFDDEDTAEAAAALNRLESESALVPAIWPLEVANALLAAERRERISMVAIDRFLQLLQRLPVRIDHAPNISTMHVLLSVARDRHLSVYDASYLELCSRTQRPLATGDRRLREAAVAANLPLISDDRG